MGIYDLVDQHEKIYDLLKVIDDKFITLYKVLTSILIMKFSSKRFTSVRGMREHIIQMSKAQLKNLEIEVSIKMKRGW